MTEPFIAQIGIWANTFAPRGWAYCDGQILSISQYTALFSLVGTTYGGDGRTTFALPDLRSRVALHAGTGPGLPPHLIGRKGGSPTETLSTAQMPVHNHLATTDLTAARPATNAPGTTNAPGGNIAARSNIEVRGGSATGNVYGPPDTSMAPQLVGGTVTVSNVGGSQGHDNMQPFLAISYAIAMLGIYPSRN